MTEDEKARVAAVAESARKLVGEGWDEITGAIVRYAGTVEAGFLLPAARPRAREFLRYVERVAALSQELNASKAVYPEYLKDRQTAIGRALAFMGNPKTRARGYASLDSLWQDDELRRQIERSNISPTAQQGITYAYYVVWQQEASAAAAKGEVVAPMGPALRDACRKVAATLEKMQGWPPKTMSAALKPSYARQEMILRTDMEQAGRAYPSDRPNGFLKMRDAATRAGDLELIVRADAALAVVTRLRPARAGLIGAQVAKLAQDLASSPEAADAPRQTLADLVQPLEDLESVPDAGCGRGPGRHRTGRPRLHYGFGGLPAAGRRRHRLAGRRRRIHPEGGAGRAAAVCIHQAPGGFRGLQARQGARGQPGYVLGLRQGLVALGDPGRPGCPDDDVAVRRPGRRPRAVGTHRPRLGWRVPAGGGGAAADA